MSEPGCRGDASADAPRPGARRVAVLLEYDGSEYAGWQSQAHARSVQQAVEDAIAFVAAAPAGAVCAGRTDAGVHAVGQVIHFDTLARRTPRAWVLGANTRLPPAIAFKWAGEVAADFHARHSALRRIYRYLILNSSARSALRRLRTAWIHRALDIDAMRAAAQVLLGEHDFSAFRSVECQSKSRIRRVERIAVEPDGDCVRIEISANAYLHHMVRNIVGTLLDVQEQSDPCGAMRRILESRDRRLAGATAPAAGLYLWRVEYPPAHGIPAPDGRFC
ncbi:MAG TPA: tRNA pseudouridine(38-40) synthase TruA [Steroidobacteraceae bacterium]|nr:tRNA pseudouridine(38-40) synthase TruA [Steroidobacteraceae bacterium]